MGQKVNANGFRIGITRPWVSQWIADKKDYSETLKQDFLIRKLIKAKCYKAGVGQILVSRIANKLTIIIDIANPGLIMGKDSNLVASLTQEIKNLCCGKQVFLSFKEISNPQTQAQLVAESIVSQIENRVPFKRAVKLVMARVKKNSAVSGLKVVVSGRLDGAEIARCEKYAFGSMPLQTLNANINYGLAVAKTIFGSIGVKCWIYQKGTEDIVVTAKN